MLARRIIACLDVRDSVVVKGASFADLRCAGDPAALAWRYDREGVDELVMLDVTATQEGRVALRATIGRIADQLFIPLTVGGGIRSEDDAAAMFGSGADKISLNRAALADPGVISRLAKRYGSQAVVVSIDARREHGGWRVYSHGGSTPHPIDVRDWARRAHDCGAGEILLTSIDRDGTRDGFDCELTSAVSGSLPIPVIASGGAGRVAHFADVFERGRADAALAASVFHDGNIEVATLKRELADRGIPMRLDW